MLVGRIKQPSFGRDAKHLGKVARSGSFQSELRAFLGLVLHDGRNPCDFKFERIPLQRILPQSPTAPAPSRREPLAIRHQRLSAFLISSFLDKKRIFLKLTI